MEVPLTDEEMTKLCAETLDHALILMCGITGALIAYLFIGAGVLATVDRDGRLHRWVERGPSEFLKMLVFLLWPITAMVYVLRR